MTVFMKANMPNDATATNAMTSITQLPASLETTPQEIIEMEIVSRPYGTTKDGHEVKQYICKNANGYTLEMIDYGATVTAFRTPNKAGLVENVTLSCSDLEGYAACSSYFGSTVGRYCNRIAQGKFTIDGVESTLAANNGENHLHGGTVGFDKRVWKSEPLVGTETQFVGVRFKLISDDGDEGYPGKLDVSVEYTLNNANELKVEFFATTDKPTYLNLTNHNYWNLGGASSGQITEHSLKLESDKYLPVDAAGIPTGEVANVENTPFDFRSVAVIGSRLNDVQSDPIGYDHNYALRSTNGELALAATVTCPTSGRKMEIHTTQPGIQFYSGNFLDGQPGSGGFAQYGAFCLETQHFPDSPNQPSFPSTLLKPGEKYHQTTIHKFSVN
ncbi:MAG: aldose 1-epimerase [Mariniblastus sp.]|jgi:aldose 1-epimerase